MGVRLIPVATFGGAGGRLWEQFNEQFEERRVKLPTEKTWSSLTSNSRNALQAVKTEIAGLPWLMIVHGRSPDRKQLMKILKKFDIKKPFVLCEEFETGKTIPTMFKQEALRTDAAIALFTPGDEAASLLDERGNSLDPSELRKRAQARQNVCVEYGWFWGRLGLKLVLLIIKGKLELPSDPLGLAYVHYKKI